MQFVYPRSPMLPCYCYLNHRFPSPLIAAHHHPTSTARRRRSLTKSQRRHSPIFLSSSFRCPHHKQIHRRHHVLLVKYFIDEIFVYNLKTITKKAHLSCTSNINRKISAHY